MQRNHPLASVVASSPGVAQTNLDIHDTQDILRLAALALFGAELLQSSSYSRKSNAYEILQEQSQLVLEAIPEIVLGATHKIVWDLSKHHVSNVCSSQ